MKFGIIGFGKIARKFVRSIESTEGQVVAIGSRSVKEDDEYLQSHQDVKVYQDYEELLKDENVEAVYIALPHAMHKEWIIKAIQHHKAVLSEKPLVIDSKDIDEIKEAVYQYNGYCLEAFKTKFNDGYQALKQDLKLIGDIETISTNFCSDTSSLSRESYLFDPIQGGALNDVGSYIIGFILGLVDSDIQAIETEMKVEDGIDYWFITHLHFENDIVGIGEGSISYPKERAGIIKGTLGTIEIPMYNRIIDYKIILENETIERHYPIEGDDMSKEIQALIDDVKNGLHESPIHSLDDSKYLQEVIQEIKKAGNE